jgi:hypothetical protein
MDKEPLGKIIKDYSKKPYVDRMLLVSSVSGTIFSAEKSKTTKESLAYLLSVTYEGIKEIVSSAGFRLREVDVRTHNGHSIVIKPLNESYFLAVQLKTMDQRILDEIDNLVTSIEPRIGSLNHQI